MNDEQKKSNIKKRKIMKDLALTQDCKTKYEKSQKMRRKKEWKKELDI